MDESGSNVSAGRVSRSVGLLLLAGLASLLVLVAPGPAQAHTDLVGGSPGPGRVVPATTDRLVLTFSEDVVPVGSQVVVRDRAGHEVTRGAPKRSGSSLVVRLRLLEPGRHEVVYRVVGADGHPVTGGYRFVVAPAGASASSSAQQEGGISEVRDTAGPGLTSPSPSGAAEAGATGSPLRWVLPAAAGLAFVLMVLHALSRRVARTARRA